MLPPKEHPNAESAEDSQSSQRPSENELSKAAIGAAIEVQRNLGTGLLESAYAAAFACELHLRGIPYEAEVPIVATYKGEPLGIGYRADFIVGNRLLIELKAMEGITEVHRAQALSYLRLSGLRLALLINFHASPLATRGITRLVNQL